MTLSYMPHDGDGHAAGRALLAQMYLQQTGQPLPDIAVTDMGKPYFTNCPLHFSISHTKNFVFCALSEKPIGIDAEPLDRAIDLRLADKILSPSERIFYDAARDKQQTLLRFWVLKEAGAKCSGKGIPLWPNDTAFCPDDNRIQRIEDCLVAVIEEE